MPKTERVESVKMLDGFVRLADVAEQNPHLFSGPRALQKFTVRYRKELIAAKAIGRIGHGRTSPVVLHPGRLKKLVEDMAVMQ